MKNEMNMNLPANCAVMTEEEMAHVNGGFTLTAPAVAAGVAVAAAGAMALNMLGWFKGDRETNFIQDSIRFGQNFIEGSVKAGADFLNKLMGISTL